MPSPKTRVAGTLHAPSAMGLRVGAGDSLLKAVEQLGEGETVRGRQKTAREHNEYLYS